MVVPQSGVDGWTEKRRNWWILHVSLNQVVSSSCKCMENWTSGALKAFSIQSNVPQVVVLLFFSNAKSTSTCAEQREISGRLVGVFVFAT